MNAYERVMRRLAGGTVDRPPNFDILMAFAAHHIGARLRDYYLDYRVLCAANFAVQEEFNLDIVQAISDPYREAVDLGLEVVFPDDGLPVKQRSLVEDPSDLAKLEPIKPSEGERMSDRLQAVQWMRENVGGEVPVMGWVEGALAEAADLRGDTPIMLDLYDRPEWLKELLEFCTEVEIEFAKAQVEAGADIIGLGDAIASQVSPQMYEEFALPYEKRIFDAVHEMGALARLHICGDTSRIVEPMARTGADIIDLDWMVDFRAAVETLGETPVLCGNFNPVTVMHQGTPEDVREATLYCMTWGGPRAISAAGCEIPDGTPPENLHAQTEALWEFGRGQAA